MGIEEEQYESNPYMPSPQYQMGQEVHLYRLNNKDILAEIEHGLRGEVFVNDKWIKKETSWANENGISTIMTIIRSSGLNKNITLGNLNHEEVYDRCRLLWQKLAYLFCVSYHKYGIEKAKRDMLIHIIVFPIHSALSRSEMGREAKQLSTTTQHVEHTMREDKVRQPSPFNPARILNRREL